jgi:hypothetical protein
VAPQSGGVDSAIRGGDPTKGALWGGAAGAAGPVVGKVVGAGLNQLGRTVRAAITPEAEAASQVSEAMGKDAGKGISAPDFVDAQARGQPVAIMDLGSRATQRLARRAANMSPKAHETLQRTTGSRYRTQNVRTADWLDGSFHYPNAEATEDALKQVARTVKKPSLCESLRRRRAWPLG